MLCHEWLGRFSLYSVSKVLVCCICFMLFITSEITIYDLEILAVIKEQTQQTCYAIHIFHN